MQPGAGRILISPNAVSGESDGCGAFLPAAAHTAKVAFGRLYRGHDTPRPCHPRQSLTADRIRCLQGGLNLIRAEFCSRRECHLFSFAVQFNTMDIGALSACLTCVLIRNRCPSRLTS
jgi:hypothetical protein